ncbi:MAG: hypothetical protein ABIQ07_06235, partial [Ginsengibacter sp.]
MKKILLVIILFQVLYSCSSDEKKTTEDSKAKNEVGVQNVNGTLPDTTNAINLGTQKKDTLQSKDSV